MATPCFTRAQKAFTRTDSSANAIIEITASAVRMNRVSRGSDAKKDRSKASRSAKSGGLGNTPWVKAKIRITLPMTRSKIASTVNDEATAGYEEWGTDCLVKNRRMTSPPRAGTTLLKP